MLVENVMDRAKNDIVIKSTYLKVLKDMENVLIYTSLYALGV